VSALGALGRLARTARRIGLGSALAAARDGADRALLALGRPPLRVSVDGVELRGFFRHRSFLAHLARGDYELLSRSAFREGLADADLVADVGAHVGFYTLLAAREAPAASVVAFEPDPYNAAALRSNVARAGASGVRVVESAVSDSAGRASFRQALGTIGSSLVPRTGGGPTRDIEVATTTLDAALGGLSGRRLLLKLDVEGAERAALRGGERALRSAAAVVAIVELNPDALAQAGATPAELLGDLRALDLDVGYLDEEAGAVVEAAPGLPKGNLLARRQ
jgi:FkbM family methyltransferase